MADRQLSVAPGAHVVHFYARDDDLVDTVGRYLAEGIEAGQVALVVASAAHRRALQDALTVADIDVGQARATGHLVELEVGATLAQFMVDGRPDRGRFEESVGGLLRDLSSNGRTVRAYGEMVAALWCEGNVSGAIELEGFWNDLSALLPLTLFCAYPSAAVEGGGHAEQLDAVCRLHAAVIASRTQVEGFGAQRELWFERAPISAQAARRFVVDTFEAWGHAELAGDAAIVVTELAANAVNHAGTAFKVHLSLWSATVLLSVTDFSPDRAVRREPGPMATDGRGMALVSALSSRWGEEMQGEGKVVWAEFDLPSD